MLKRRLCEARFDWTLRCEGPLLIADGRYNKEKAKEDERKQDPQKIFISRATGDALLKGAKGPAEHLKLPFFVPGTSVRGPFRAQAERIIRSLVQAGAVPPKTACDPFDMGEAPLRSCSKRLDSTKVAVPYASACPACRLFGCTGTASRIRFEDSDLPAIGSKDGPRSVYRDMIGIDRFTGGVHSGANMRLHALENVSFSTAVTVQNFELWQLGLLAYVFQDFADGLVPVGFGKSKGFGQVKGQVMSATLTYPRGKEEKIHHLGSLCSAAERESYGLQEFDAPQCSVDKAKPTGLHLYDSFTVKDLPSFWGGMAAAFDAFVADLASEEKS
ncbi:MAG TPA: RAMP superfamily CRISPR-associated protein [Thermoanaerobaculia bacterium]|nr:RAMP superfamily CRISPR-associated protein [Thermoanaerobaculia bacterium]